MQALNTSSVTKSASNSSSAVLLANEIFTGDSVQVDDFIQVVVHCISDTPEVSLEIQFCDNAGVNDTWSTFYTFQSNHFDNNYTINGSKAIAGKHMRIVYTNGVQDQTMFALSVFLNRYRDPELLGTVSGKIVENQNTNIVRLGSDYKRDIAMGKIEGNGNFTVNGTRVLSVMDEWTTLASVSGTDYTFPTVARKLYASSTSTDDTYGTGIGAWVVYIKGLDVNFVEIEETLVLTGTTNSASTVQEFIRVNTFACAVIGGYNSVNIGTIVLTSETDLNEMTSINPGDGRSLSGIYTVPVGHSCVVPRVTLCCGNNHTADFKGFYRQNNIPIAPPYTSPIIVNHVYDFSGITELKPEQFVRFNEGTDFWIMSKKTSGTGSVGVGVIYDVDIIHSDQP